MSVCVHLCHNLNVYMQHCENYALAPPPPPPPPPLCTSLGWFKHIEPRRTFSNHIITKIARCVGFCHMSSGGFDCTEPCYHCEDEVREGSVQLNHSELTSKTSTHLAYSALKWFEKVRGGSLWEPLGNSVQVPYTPCSPTV